MHIVTMIELLHLTRTELCDHEARAVAAMHELPEGSAARERTLVNLRNVRRVLTWRARAPQ